jgi:hypothetical protein
MQNNVQFVNMQNKLNCLLFEADKSQLYFSLKDLRMHSSMLTG